MLPPTGSRRGTGARSLRPASRAGLRSRRRIARNGGSLARRHAPGGRIDLRRAPGLPNVFDHELTSTLGSAMAVFRILEARVRPGSVDRVLQLLVQQQRDIVASAPGAVFVQSLRSGDQVLAVSSWESEQHLQRYLDQEVTREFYRVLPELLMGTPTVRTYQVIQPEAGGPGWVDGGPAGDGGNR